MARAGLSPVMVGRANELIQLSTMLRGGARRRVALVSGEAGVGKTRLIQELVASVAGSVPVLTGQAEQGAMGRPYQLLLESVATEVASWTRVPAALRPWEDALAALLGPVAPLLAVPDERRSSDELARAATELVRHLVGSGPGLVVFEDLHWADAESLSLFRHLAGAPGIPILLVGTYRPEDLDRRHVTDLLAAIERQHQVEHLVLGRLPVEDVRGLVAAVRQEDVSFATAADLHRRTSGNPFFLEELLLAAGSASVEELADRPLPATVTEAVLRHLDGLGADQRSVVDAAALLGQRIPFDLLAAVTGLGEDALVDVLRALVGQALLVEEDTDVFAFRHALTREAVAARLLGRERRRLHEKALAALQELGSDDWAALAYHAAGANRWDDVVLAARAGAANYLRTGATYQALRLAELGLAEMDCDLDLLELATRASWSVGLTNSAVERAEQWRRLAADSGDDIALAHALRVLARLRWESGDVDAHLAAVAAAAAVCERLPVGEERAWVANLQAESAMLTRDHEEAVAFADRALELAGPPPIDAALLAAIAVNKGSALSGLAQNKEEAIELLLAGLDGAERAFDFLSALRAMNNLSHIVFRLWPVERIADHLERMGRLVQRSGREDWRPSWHVLRAIYFAHVVGDLAAARNEVTVAKGATPTPGGWSELVGAELALEAGEDAQAAQLIDDLTTQRSTTANGEDRVISAGLGVRLAARSGDVTAMRQALEALVHADATFAGYHEAGSGDIWYHAAVSVLAAGFPADEIEKVMASVPASALCPPDDPAWADHLRGALAERRGQLTEAVDAYQTAARRDLAIRRSPPALADAHLGAARSLLALGRHGEARNHAETARELLSRWPGWRLDEATALLHRLGEGRTRVGDGELTAREAEVVALVAQGLTNGQIAARLFISTKTASVHVSNLLRKLGLSSRRDLAEWVRAQDL